MQAADETVVSTPVEAPIAYPEGIEHTAVLPPVPVAAPPGSFAQPAPYGQPDQYPGGVPPRTSNAPIIVAVAAVILLIAGGVVWIVLANQGSGNNNSSPVSAVVPTPSPTDLFAQPSPTPVYPTDPYPTDTYSYSSTNSISRASIPTSAGSFCQDDSSGSNVSDVAVGDANESQTGSECQFAESVQSAYENQTSNGSNASYSVDVQVYDSNNNQVDMTCTGSGPVTCDGADSGSSDTGSPFTVYLAYDNSNNIPTNP